MHASRDFESFLSQAMRPLDEARSTGPSDYEARSLPNAVSDYDGSSFSRVSQTYEVRAKRFGI